MKRLLAALACAVLPLGACAAAQSACTATARHAITDVRIRAAIAEARRQNQLFGGQFIDRDGGLFRLGYHEAEWDHAPGESTGAWQRVATFWRALSEDEPPRVMTSAGWVPRSEAAREAAKSLVEGSREDVAVRESLLRAAIVDTPWSAAFISYLMKTAGFTSEEFAFSDSHADYVRAALDASAAEAEGHDTPYAFRACDIATTPPRAGDLVCATRASSAGIAKFDALAATLAERSGGETFPMHCELVVRADEGGDAKIDTIGGNVIQSVTLSRMTLNAQKVLGAQYVGATTPAACARGTQPCRQHLTRRPWVAVLQFRK